MYDAVWWITGEEIFAGAIKGVKYGYDAWNGTKYGAKIVKTVGNAKIPIYRVYGKGASMYGKSYSIINPKYVPYYRKLAGLPNANSGQYLLKGSIKLKDVRVGRWLASPLNGNMGGLPFELYQNYNQLYNAVNVIIKKPF